MKTLSYYLIFLFCANTLYAQLEFKIEGNLKSDENSDFKKVYLRSELKILDSTQIKNNRFIFKGNVFESTQVYIDSYLNKKNIRSDWFWIESGVTTKIENFNKGIKANIIGGETQRQSNLLELKLIDLRNRRDSLEAIINDIKSSKLQIEKANTSYDELYREAMDTNINFIKEYPNSILSMSIIYNTRGRLGLDYVKKFYYSANESAKKSFHGLKIENYLNLFKILKKGDKFIDFTHNNNHNIPCKFSTLRKDITLIQFWNPEIQKSVENNIELIDLYEDYKNKKIEIVGVALTRNKDKWQEIIRRDKLTWPQLSELKGWDSELGFKYGVYILPLNYLIDKKGEIIQMNLTANELRAILRHL